MLKKVVTGILSLVLCASTLSPLRQTACANEIDPALDPTPIVAVETEDTTPPVGGEEQIECASEFPEPEPAPIDS